MCAKSTCGCAYIYIYVHVRIKAYLPVFVLVCMGIYMYAYMYVNWHCGCIQMLCVHIQICVYISGFVRVCVCVYTYTYMYKETPCVYTKCLNTNTYTSVLVSCLQMSFIYRWVLYVCVGICIYACTRERHHGWIQTHCVRIGIHAHVSVFVHGCVCIRMYAHIYEKTPCVYTNLHMCVYILVYIHADFTCGCVSI